MIEVKGLTKIFDDYKALDNLSCTIKEGCIYGMVGSNGAGKSTFLRLVNGIYKPDAGSILVDGEAVYENEYVKKNMTFVPDELFFLSGADMERMALLYERMYENFDKDRFYKLSQGFGLNTRKHISTFSKGMKRQAATILALSTKPKYLFMDETFDGLDPVMRNLVKGIICEDVAERGMTAILTSHSLRELEDTCDQLSLLHRGGLVFESDITDLKTSLFKVQVAFSMEYDKSLFEGVEILNYKKQGSVANIIVRGDRDKVVSDISAKSPILLEVIPLTLEEVFTYEMEALGYSFNDVTLA